MDDAATDVGVAPDPGPSPDAPSDLPLDTPATPDLPDDDGSADVAPPEDLADPFDGSDDCHWDCFGGVYCASGVVLVGKLGSFPCSGPDPCADFAYVCAAGACGLAGCQEDDAVLAALAPLADEQPATLELTAPLAGLTLTRPDGDALLTAGIWLAQDAAPAGTVLWSGSIPPESVDIDPEITGAAVADATLWVPLTEGSAALHVGCSGALQADLEDGSRLEIVWTDPSGALDCYGAQPVEVRVEVVAAE